MKIIVCSDTHGLHDKIDVPPGDMYIHAGDMTGRGSLDEIIEFNHYVGTLPHRHKIIIAGNHDWAFEQTPDHARSVLTNATYVFDETIEVEGIKIYGSPWQPEFFSWAFNLRRGEEIRRKWDLIPETTDILITHGPPFGICDRTRFDRVGCRDLRAAVTRVKPKYHIFGHIHEGYGMVDMDDVVFINASNCNEHYEPINPPVCFEYATAD